MAARQIMTMTMAIVLQKLNVAQIALGAKKVVSGKFYDEYKSSRNFVEGKLDTKPRITKSTGLIMDTNLNKTYET